MKNFSRKELRKLIKESLLSEDWELSNLLQKGSEPTELDIPAGESDLYSSSEQHTETRTTISQISLKLDKLKSLVPKSSEPVKPDNALFWMDLSDALDAYIETAGKF